MLLLNVSANTLASVLFFKKRTITVRERPNKYNQVDFSSTVQSVERRDLNYIS